MESLLFSLTAALCSRFPGLTPFSVYRESFHDVLSLFADLKQEQETAAIQKANNGIKPPDGSFMRGNTLYIPSQNDDWY
jgi:hypothetical protein